MKTLLAFLFCFAVAESSQAQFLDKMAKKAKKKIEREAEKRTERRINKGIDKAFDKTEEGIDGAVKGGNESSEKQGKSAETSHRQQPENAKTEQESAKQAPQINVQWSRFDFVPGDEVIFEDSPDMMEENGEFPSRWDLYEGGAEIANAEGANVILFITESGNMYRKGIIPYLKNPKEDYLPEVFTIEFDGYFNPDVYNESFHITLYDRKNQSRNNIPQIDIGVNEAEMGNSSAKLEGKRGNKDDVAGWRHISIAYTKGKAKVYLDETRLINIPRLEGNPTGITLSASHKNMFVKNFRLAKGGVKYYDRVMQDGKIICNGIRFDVGKASLKPESMGPINKIYELMQKQPDLKFSVEGHTDSDGDEALNQSLSEQRAKTVMEQLINMGISAERLTSKGFGESMPIAGNDTPEGKANNRRVEFVKL